MTRRAAVLAADQTIPMASSATDELTEYDDALRPGYDVGKVLGRGGEGEVHEAKQLSFGRPVAIKVLRYGHNDQRKLRRFRAEAAITALLEHPNIVPVHDLCRDDGGRLQLVMKRVSGKTWREILNAGTTSLEQHISVLLKVCDAMGFAHGQGILHRDLKPENVMVGEHGEVLLMDWGCAIHVGPVSPHPDIPVLSSLRSISGTPAYLSPEQARGEHVACGPWSDVYQLGAILYRMIAGVTPRPGNDVPQIMSLTARGAPITEPSTLAGKRVSGELCAIAMAALHADPTKRTRTVADFAKALHTYLEHREVLDLVVDARREHTLASAGGAEAEDAFRRSLCAAEQAVRLWPELLAAQKLLVTIGIDASQHANESGAFLSARRHAQAAAAAAARLGDETSVRQARKLHAAAAASEKVAGQRERRVRTLIRAVIIAVSIAVLILTVGSLMLSNALSKAQANLDVAERERTARVAGEKLAGPALLAQARELAGKRQFAAALPLVDAAAGFMLGDPEPLRQRAQLLIALGRRQEAIPVLDAALTFTTDADTSELRRLCAKPPADAEIRLAEVLVRMGASAVAGTLSLAGEERVATAIAQLKRYWPTLPNGCVTPAQDGTLSIRLTGRDLKIDSLEPLRGMPISILDISGQDRVRDLAPLTSLPLLQLTAKDTGVRDFTPLRQLKPSRLYLGWYDTGFDLGLVRGMRLEALDAPGTNVTDLASLAGMPLKELRLYGCNSLVDISALKSMPIDTLTLDAPLSGWDGLSDLSPLASMPLTELCLSRQRGVHDIAPLRGKAIGRLVLNGTSVKSLAGVPGAQLRHLAISGTPISDLRPALVAPLETLECSPQTITTGLDAMLELPTLRVACGLRPVDCKRWIKISQSIAEVNPDYSWMGTWIFNDGRLVELRLAHPIGNLAPLGALSDLRILQLAGPIADLRPILGLQLTELVCNPIPNALGLDGLRTMRTLKNIGPSTQTVKPAADWWRERK